MRERWCARMGVLTLGGVAYAVSHTATVLPMSQALECMGVVGLRGVSRHLQTRGMAATVPLASLHHLICTHQHRQTFGSQLVGHAVLAPMPPLGGLLQSASLSLSSFFCPAWLCYGSWRTSRLVVSMFAEGLGRHPAWHSYVLLASWHHALD